MHKHFAFVLAGIVVFLVGCASTPPSQHSAITEGVAFKKDPHLQKVWLADGFDFNGYHTLCVVDTRIELAKPLKDPKEIVLLEWAKPFLQKRFALIAQEQNLFANVVTDEAAIKSGVRALRLENTIIEFAKGSGAARFWAGEFGAGQPVLRVVGRMSDGGKPVFIFESFRSGDSVNARLDPGWTSEQRLQTLDIMDLAHDWADFIAQTSRHQPRR